MTEEKLAFYQSAFPVWEDLTPQQRDLLLSSTIEKTFPKGPLCTRADRIVPGW